MIGKNLYQDELIKVIEDSGLRKYVAGTQYKLEFKDLMRFRVDKILLVCSLYDYYIIVDDGHLQEAIFSEYLELNLHYAPHITHTYSGESALKYLKTEEFDLVITSLRLGDMELHDFAKQVKINYKDIPLVLLASQSRELSMLEHKKKLDYIDKTFIWSGDRKVFLAIIKLLEDEKNAINDCYEHGVPVIILVEDSPMFYSAYLPLIYTELLRQTQILIEESRNSAEKLLKQRARPKILHAETYEQFLNYFNKYQKNILGIITDMKFKKDNVLDENAGEFLISKVKNEIPQLPILLQTSQDEKKEIAEKLHVGFANKNSRTLLMELREFMNRNFGFGDFIFTFPDGTEIIRARSLKELRDRIKYIATESLLFHSKNNHFSMWLIARTYFVLAYKLRPIHINQFMSPQELRDYLVNEITEQLIEEQRGVVSSFSRDEFDSEKVFQIIGDGSLGGKARGLAFIDKVLKNYVKHDYFKDVSISIPKTIVIGTDVFSQFIEGNDLYHLALQNIPNERVIHEFLKGSFPATVLGDLREIVKKIHYPLAIRSSSLLEDAMYQPFAGIYDTVMIPNSSIDIEVRFSNMLQAIKLVYASTFSKNAKNYIEATGNRIEEEKMGVIIQEVVGRKYDHYYYPHFSGVARSYNYYPFGKATTKDGIVSLAIGLGKSIVDGGTCLQYSPAYPGICPQFATRKDYFSKSQNKYWALDLTSDIVRKTPKEDMHLSELSISDAESHHTLNFLASTYSNDNDMLYEGIHRTGPRIINFAPILKSEVFPLNKIVKLLLKMCEVSMNCPVEIEFAVVLGSNGEPTGEFRFLQVRPMVKPEGIIEINFDNIVPENLFLRTDMALGNGIYNIDRVLYVKPSAFDPAKTRLIAEEINPINQKLLREDKSYMLIGPGRWGSSDPWLGIPVNFSYISAANVIVEAPMPHMVVDPSQGSHFFQNMTSFKIAYLTLKNGQLENSLDWAWLELQETLHETEFLKLVKLSSPLQARVDGQSGRGVIIKN